MATDKKARYKGWAMLSDDAAKAERERLAARKEAAAKNAAGRPTNAYFATHDKEFQNACRKAGCEATARQASKWLRKRGSAYTKGR